MALEIFEEGRDAPEKHAGVPMVVAARDIFLCDRKGRLFRETANGENGKAVRMERFAHALDVAEAGFGTGRRNAENDHAAGFVSDV